MFDKIPKVKFKFASIFFFDLFMLLWIFIIVQNLFVDPHLTLLRLEEREGALFYNKLYLQVKFNKLIWLYHCYFQPGEWMELT